MGGEGRTPVSISFLRGVTSKTVGTSPNTDHGRSHLARIVYVVLMNLLHLPAAASGGWRPDSVAFNFPRGTFEGDALSDQVEGIESRWTRRTDITAIRLVRDRRLHAGTALHNMTKGISRVRIMIFVCGLFAQNRRLRISAILVGHFIWKFTFSAKLPQKLRRQISKSWLVKFPNMTVWQRWATGFAP